MSSRLFYHCLAGDADPEQLLDPDRHFLYRYLVERDGNFDGRLIVALEGRLSEERDLDADAGALLGSARTPSPAWSRTSRRSPRR
jgi:hypothetical protein